MIKRDNYQDKYNPSKVWQVCHLKGGVYLKQFVNGIQQGRGIRTNKKFIRDVGIFDMVAI